MADIFVRVCLFWLEEPNLPGDIESQLLFDLKIDEDSKEVVGAHPVFGMYGSLKSGEMYPFVLRSDGRIDFGDSNESAQDRYWETNLRKRLIKKGELITVEETEGPSTYRIESVSILGVGEPS
jgi:hypothetical protein